MHSIGELTERDHVDDLAAFVRRKQEGQQIGRLNLWTASAEATPQATSCWPKDAESTARRPTIHHLRFHRVARIRRSFQTTRARRRLVMETVLALLLAFVSTVLCQ